MQTKQNTKKYLPRLELSYAERIHKDALWLIQQARKRRWGWLRRSL